MTIPGPGDPGRLPSPATDTSDTANAARTIPHATTPDARRDQNRTPMSPFTTNPAKGRSGISHNSPVIGLALQDAHVVDQERVAIAEERQHDRQPDGDLSRRDGDCEDAEDLPADVVQLAAERHQV